jgi:hypothetical protein
MGVARGYVHVCRQRPVRLTEGPRLGGASAISEPARKRCAVRLVKQSLTGFVLLLYVAMVVSACETEDAATPRATAHGELP